MGLKKLIVDLTPSPLFKVFARPYVAGDSIEAAVATANRFWQERKLHSTIDLLGEELERDDEVQYTVDIYTRLLTALGRQEHATISLKPTQLGSHRGMAHCRDIIAGILEQAGTLDIPVTLDMEDHTFTDLTLDIFRELKARFPTFGTVLQSRLFRTPEDIRSLKGLQARIRICIGIYNEPAAIAMVHKPEMKKQMLKDIEQLFDEGHYPEIATHDEPLIRAAVELAEKRNIPRDAYEVQMLMGVPRATIQDELTGMGIKVRLYVPFAEKWGYAISYCKRRLAANPMMAAYVMRNMASYLTGRR